MPLTLRCLICGNDLLERGIPNSPNSSYETDRKSPTNEICGEAIHILTDDFLAQVVLCGACAESVSATPFLSNAIFLLSEICVTGMRCIGGDSRRGVKYALTRDDTDEDNLALLELEDGEVLDI